MAADEHDDVAGLRIRHRNSGICRAGNRDRDPGHHLERDALLVQEQGFLAAAVEHEGVAPLESNDHLAFARLFGEQEGDRILVERPGRGRADVDALGVAPRSAQQPGVDLVVVDDDIRGFETALSADADERRITGPGPDDIDTGQLHKRLLVTTTSLDRSGGRHASPHGFKYVECARACKCIREPMRQARRIVAGSRHLPANHRTPVRRRDEPMHADGVALVQRDRAERQLATSAQPLDQRTLSGQQYSCRGIVCVGQRTTRHSRRPIAFPPR